MKKPLVISGFIFVFLAGYFIGNNSADEETNNTIVSTEVNSDEKSSRKNDSVESDSIVITSPKDLNKENSKYHTSVNTEEEKSVDHSDTKIDANQSSDKANSPDSDIVSIFNEENIDGSWSFDQESKIRELFENEVIISDGILLSEVSCKTATCRLQIENFDTSKENLSIMSITETLYTAEWSAQNSIKIQPTDDPNSRVVFVTDNTRK